VRVALFEFELEPVEDIEPWGEPGNQSLSWFALTLGNFRVHVGDQVLFRYTDEILSHWQSPARDADYQIAAFARDILESVAAGVARLPKSIERLASDWQLLEQLRTPSDSDADPENEDDIPRGEDRYYKAWRWIGERSPWTSYLVANPEFLFIRIGDDLHIHWDNRERSIDGIPVWVARYGVHVLPVASFLEECRGFADRLLAAMEERLAGIEAGSLRPRIAVDVHSLRQQHATWRDQFASYFEDRKPDIPWEVTEHALRTLARNRGVIF